MSYQMMLIAAQSAGIATNIWKTSQASKLAGVGADLDRRAIDLQMQQNALVSTQQAISNAQNFRDVIAAQNVQFATRGQTGGSAASLQNDSVREFNKDERTRKLNLDIKNAQSAREKSKISTEASNAKGKIWGNLLKSSFDKLDLNTFKGNKLNQPTGKL